MDLTAVIDAAIERLPKGEYSPGLAAIQRHITAAVRHFERDDDGTQDSFTDAIYRCNQAFEGGLKEAYRVMTGKDPSRLTPHKIEEYLQKQNVIRPRALKQLTRYREDYRNPSAHDYKLDFDEDEALLAIVAVCAFTKLLVNQISGKIAYEAGREATTTRLDREYTDASELSSALAIIIANILSTIKEPRIFRHNDLVEYIAGIVRENGADADVFFDNDGNNEKNLWDIVASYKGFECNIEPRIIDEVDVRYSAGWVHQVTVQGRFTVLIFFDDKISTKYQVIRKSSRGGGLIDLVVPEVELPHWSPNVRQQILEQHYIK